MSLARVVTFDGVNSERMDELAREIQEGDPPDDLPATEMIVLHDSEADRALVVVFFDNEDDYRLGDATLSAMPADDTPGTRTSVDKYRVAMRRNV